MSMKMSLIKYNLSYYFRTPKCLPPLLAFMVYFGINYQTAPIGIWSNLHIASVAVFILANWIATSFVSTEAKVQQQITRLHVKNERAFHLSKIVSILILLAPMWLVVVFFPVVTGMFPRGLQFGEILVYVITLFLMSLLGTAMGVFFNDYLFHDAYLKLTGHIVAVLAVAIPFNVVFEDIRAVVIAYNFLPPVNFLAERFYALGEGVFRMDLEFLIFVLWAVGYALALFALYVITIPRLQRL